MRCRVKGRKSGRIGIWRHNRHPTMRSINASIGEAQLVRQDTALGVRCRGGLRAWWAQGCPGVRSHAKGVAVVLQSAQVRAVLWPKACATLALMGLNFLSLAGFDYVRHANDTIVTIAMIETAEALDNLDDILSVEGQDATYIGPSDLSPALGCEPTFDNLEPKAFEAVEHILARAKAHGVAARATAAQASPQVSSTQPPGGYCDQSREEN